MKEKKDTEGETPQDEQVEPTEASEAEELEKLLEEESEKEEEKKEEPVEEAPKLAEAEAEERLLPVAEEEAKPAREEKREEEEEIVEERTYTIPLGKAWIMPPNKRAPRAMRMIRGFITKHMKMEKQKEGEEEEEEEPRKLVISNEVNERVWGRGIEKPPRKVRVRAAKDKEGNVTVYLAEGD